MKDALKLLGALIMTLGVIGAVTLYLLDNEVLMPVTLASSALVTGMMLLGLGQVLEVLNDIKAKS